MRNSQLFLTVATFVVLLGSVSSYKYNTIKVSPSQNEINKLKQANDENKGSAPLVFAVGVEVNGTLTSDTCVSVISKGAPNLNFHLDVCKLPKTCSLVISNENSNIEGVDDMIIDSSACASGELWTNIFPSDHVSICPDNCDDGDFDVHIGRVYSGFVDFAGMSKSGSKSGSCNIDVVCPESIGWESEVRSVAGIAYSGSLFCTGAMINNMEEDQTPYFLTANHCGVTASNAPSMIPYWNFETSVCGGAPDGSLDQFTLGGAQLLSSISTNDATLLRLNNSPDPSYRVSFAGWDKSPDAYEVLPGVAIHHPSGDEKRISFEFDPMSPTSYFGNNPSPSGTHVKVEDWDEGTTEPGSSGSPLFNGDHRIIGQLHGGIAACGNDSADWYGRFSQSWDNGNFATWLDPYNRLSGGGSGIDTLDPYLVPTVSPAPTSTPPPTSSPTVCTGVYLTVNLLTDNFGSETSFELVNTETNEVVLAENAFQSSTFYTFEQCLSGNCYEFTIDDSFGDGICCAYGEGYYSLTLDGAELFSGGAFEVSESYEFCVSGNCSDSPLPIDGNQMGYSCDQVAPLCDDERFADVIRSHCPATCDSCDATGCVDSLARWLYEPFGAFDCEFVGNYSGDVDICGLAGISATCPESCGVCD